MSKQKKQNEADEGFRAADSSGIPVPSRYQLIHFLDSSEFPLTLEQLCRHFNLDFPGDAEQALRSRLERLCGSGILLLDRKNRYGIAAKMDMVVGRVSGHADGFGFVIPDNGGDDLFLHHRQMRKVLHGDRVLSRIRKIDHRGKKEGTIIEVLVEPGREIIGRFHKQSGSLFVEPDDVRFAREIAVPGKHAGGAKDGDIVVVEIVGHPVEHGHAVGKVTEIVGREFAPGMEIEIALRKHEIPHTWPESVERWLEENSQTLAASSPDKDKNALRINIRDLPLVTIDGEDARDFDDAVFCEVNKDGYRLVVAIADVSHYVKSGSALDLEAWQRGTSVYFPDWVVPMLPEVLSNGICSLNPGEDRNCLVCDMQISHQGVLGKRRFYPAVMHSSARLTYETVNQIVSVRSESLRKEHSEIVGDLDALYNLYLCLKKRRKQAGSIDFELPEAAIEFDQFRKISDIKTRVRNDAHRLIEECMLAANICAAEYLQEKLGSHAIYRNHEGPDREALVDLRQFIGGFGLKLEGGDNPTALDYSHLLDQLQTRPEVKMVVQRVLLRSLSQAVYSSDQIGHFALSFPIYTHFTSPIRRYSDLIVHRLIKHLSGINGYAAALPDEVNFAQAGEQCSFTERRADDASRDVLAWLKAEFMSTKIGEQFEGTISGVKEFGIFVQLNQYLVDGLVHVTNLGHDYYHFDPVLLQLEGKRSGHRFSLGDHVRVIVSSVNMEQAKIDFELVGDGTETSNSSKQGRLKKDSGKKAGKNKSRNRGAGAESRKQKAGKKKKNRKRDKGKRQKSN